VSQIGRYQIVAVNRGTREGMEVDMYCVSSKQGKK